MLKDQCLLLAATFAVVGNLVGCATNAGALGTPATGTGGFINATGGTGASTGGTSVIESGGLPGTSGGTGLCCASCTCSRATGGASTMTSGTQDGAGGSQASTGGAQATGGKAPTGGTSNSSATTLNTGGSSASSAGGSNVGGSSATGGAGVSMGGTSGGGATNSAGGTQSSGGTDAGGTTAIDPAVSAAINACMDKLPYGGNLLSADKRAPIVTAIINTCAAFAPPGAEWQTYCQMFLVAAINAESSYDTQAGTQTTGGDPSVGLLQIRYSSVVRDFADYGPISTITRIGCDFGTVTSSDSYATKGSMMVDVTCNIAIATWYYFIFASGNGGSSVVWVPEYCSGRGVAGNLHIGIASFLMGGDAAHTSLSGADFYYNEIKSWFDPCVTYSGTHPFELTIQPDKKKYCK